MTGHNRNPLNPTLVFTKLLRTIPLNHPPEHRLRFSRKAGYGPRVEV